MAVVKALEEKTGDAGKWIHFGATSYDIVDTARALQHKSAIKLLENGLCHLVGSDAHNDKRRNFLMKPALQKIGELINQDVVEIIRDNSIRILNGNDCLSYSVKNIEKSFFNKIKSYINGK